MEVKDVPNMPFKQALITNDGAMISEDQRHIMKRMVHHFLNNGITLSDIKVTPDILLQLAKQLSVALGLDAAISQRDFMSVPSALTIVDAIIQVGERKQEFLPKTFNPTQKKQHGTTLVHEAYRGVLLYQ